MPRQIHTEWEVDLSRTSQDGRTVRTAVRKPYCAQLVNIDGRLTGGIKPFKGFSLSRHVGNAANADYDGTLVPAASDLPSEVWEVRTFRARVGSNEQVGGYVVRGKDSTSPTAVPYIFIEVEYGGTWYFKKIADPSGDPSWAVATEDKGFDIVVAGRLLYIFQKGQPPLVVWFSTSPFSINIEHTGPGAVESYPLTIESASDTAFGTGTAPRVVDLGTTSSVKMLQSVAHYFPLPVRGTSTIDTIAHRGILSANNTQTHKQATKSINGLTAAPLSVALNQVVRGLAQIAKGDYSFAYQLFNENTGRMSQLSERAVLRVEDFGDEDRVKIFAFEIPAAYLATLQSAGWTHIYLYRSVSAKDAGSPMSNVILFEEAFLPIKNETGTGDDSTYIVATPNDPTTYQGDFLYWYKLSDNALVLKDYYPDQVLFSEEMPYAGTAVNYNGLLVATDLERTGNERADQALKAGVGEVKWSSPARDSLQLFPPGNRWVGGVDYQQPHKLHIIGDRVIGLGPSRQYIIYRSGVSVGVKTQQEGWGSVSRHASATAGAVVLAVSTNGVIGIDGRGEVNQVEALDYLIQQRWRSTRSTVWCAFDAVGKVWFVMNPADGTGACLWLTTNMSSEMEDLAFQGVTDGPNPTNDEGTATSFWWLDDGRVYTPAWDESWNGGWLRDVTPEYLTVTAATSTTISFGNLVDYSDPSYIGCYVGLKHEEDGTYVGRTYKITGGTTGQVTVEVPSGVTPPDSSLVGVVCWVNGRKMRVVGPPLGLEDPSTGEGVGHDTYRSRVFTSMSCHAQRLEGPNALLVEGQHSWAAFVLKGVSDERLGAKVPTINDGTVQPYPLLSPGPSEYSVGFGDTGVEGTVMFPCWELIGRDMGFVLLSLRVFGRVEHLRREG